MLDKIIATFCLLDDLLKILHHRNVPQAKIPDREMLAIAILACQEFGGNRRQTLQPVGQSPSALLVCAFREPFQPQAAPPNAPAARPCAPAARGVGVFLDRLCVGYFSDACVGEHACQSLSACT
jgi:hypothetical protein